MIYKNHYTSVQYHNPSPREQNTTKNTKELTRRWRSENQKRVEQDRSRAGRPALPDKPSPQWKAPLRSRPRDLNIQIQGSRRAITDKR